MMKSRRTKHRNTGPGIRQTLRNAGVPVTKVVKRHDGVYVADFRTNKSSSWDGHVRQGDHVPEPDKLIRAMRRVLPEIRVMSAHESITDWREDPRDHVRFETTILFTLPADQAAARDYTPR